MNIGLSYPDGCGWFCRRLHDLKDVVDFVAPSVGTRISKLLSFIGVDADNFAFRTTELSIQDQAILDEWYKQKFEPFTIKILQLFNSLSSGGTSFYKVSIINEINSQLCLVASYHEAVAIPFLTEQGKAEMNKLIFEFSNSLLQEVAIELSKHKTLEVSKTLPFKTINPIVTEQIKGFTEYNCYQYVLTTINPVDEIPIDVIDPIDTNEPIDISNPIDETTDLINPVATETTKKKGLPWWVYVLGGYGLYKLLK